MKQNILNDLIKIDYKKIVYSIKHFLSNIVFKTNLSGFVLGLSGGIDSTVIAYLCSCTHKQDTLALVMPDREITPKNETDDALKTINKLNLNYKLLDITLIVNEYKKYLDPNENALGNLRSRIRSNILYYYANITNNLVVGSTDKSEYMLGYFTKFGDGNADVLPLISIYKTQLKNLAKFLGVSDSIINKKSSPYILKNQLAEKEIGLPYEKIDLILYCIFDKKCTIEETMQLTAIGRSSIKKIYELHKKNHHKRNMPYGFVI